MLRASNYAQLYPFGGGGDVEIWFAIGFVWVCFGFVFLISPSVHFHIFTCYKRAYVDLSVLDFGFVLHKKVDL